MCPVARGRLPPSSALFDSPGGRRAASDSSPALTGRLRFERQRRLPLHDSRGRFNSNDSGAASAAGVVATQRGPCSRGVMVQLHSLHGWFNGARTRYVVNRYCERLRNVDKALLTQRQWGHIRGHIKSP